MTEDEQFYVAQRASAGLNQLAEECSGVQVQCWWQNADIGWIVRVRAADEIGIGEGDDMLEALNQAIGSWQREHHLAPR